MEPPFIFVQGLPELEGAAAREWLVGAHELALAFSREVNGDDASSHMQDAYVLHVAATHVWIQTEGRPCWSKLDVDGYIRRFSELPLWAVYEASASITVLAFYCFLVKHGYLERRKAARVSRALERVAAPHVRTLLEIGGVAGAPIRPYFLD